MATTDTNVPQVIVNKLTSAEYATATKSPTEFYAVTDEQIGTADIANGAVTADKIDFTTLIDKIYPVGSIYMSVNNVSPATFIGGTWVAWGSGKVPVGVDSNDTDFDTAEETGGGKTHRHDFKVGTAAFYGSAICGENSDWEHWGAWSYAQNKYAKSYGFENQYSTNRNSALQTSLTAASEQTRYTVGDTDTGSSLQPYITCYMWKRTA